MRPEQQIAFLKWIHKIIFDSKEKGEDITNSLVSHPDIKTSDGGHIIKGRWFANKTVRGFDIPIMDNGVIKPLRIIEQNPNKTDEFGNLTSYAQLARQGHKIVWVIRRDTNKYLGKVHGANWVKSVDRAVQSVKTRGPIKGTIYTKPGKQAQEELDAKIQSITEDTDWSNMPDCAPEDVCNFVGGGEWEYP